MCRAIEEMLDEVREKTEMRTRIEVTLNMINDGELSLEEIAQYSGLPLEKVKELAPKKSA